jgi:hypothetical protein
MEVSAQKEGAMTRTRLAMLLAPLIVLLASAPATAVKKCLVWVWIDGWRCAVGI